MTAPVGTIFMWLTEFLDKVMQMVTTPRNHSCIMLDALTRAGVVCIS